MTISIVALSLLGALWLMVTVVATGNACPGLPSDQAVVSAAQRYAACSHDTAAWSKGGRLSRRWPRPAVLSWDRLRLSGPGRGTERRPRRWATSASGSTSSSLRPCAAAIRTPRRQSCASTWSAPHTARAAEPGIQAVSARGAVRVGPAGGSTGRPPRTSSWIWSLTSQMLTFMPASTRPPDQPERDELARVPTSPRTTTSPVVAARGHVPGVLHARGRTGPLKKYGRRPVVGHRPGPASRGPPRLAGGARWHAALDAQVRAEQWMVGARGVPGGVDDRVGGP